MKVKDLRDSFIDFFKQKEHRIIPSSSLVPKDDPTLLFTTAGMVQFKPMFAGTVDLEYTRAATIQKCLRTSDLENVGRTKRHMTFFEMLGNFSFGDYFKEEAIQYAWDYSTDVIGFKPENIWVSIYLDDDEAFEIWNKKIGLPADKIVRLGKEDNFWGPAGDTGACGPCSELYYDRGDTFGCNSKDCKPGCECERFLEYWNLVFNQFFQDESGNLNPLPKTGIDTGMGLERLATLIQNVDSVYDIDEMQQLIGVVAKDSGKSYEGENIIPMRVVVEHARALTFAMSDGIYPSNEGRGYVLRRILRRSLRYTRQLGFTKPYVYTLVDHILNIMGPYYPTLKDSAKNIKNVIESEEKRFLETIENGLERLEDILKTLKEQGKTIISGKDAFQLYDTFGFPLEMTQEIAEERACSVDLTEYEKEMEEQRQRGKESWKGSEGTSEQTFMEIASMAGDTVFTGYTENGTKTAIDILFADNKLQDSLDEGEAGIIITEESSFYGESGGQVGDTGKIISSNGANFQVSDTKIVNKTIMHIGKMISGSMKKGETVTTTFDEIKKNLIKANHTATHLLQAALKNVLGEHVKQAGSLVDPERLRFDFSHFNAMTEAEIKSVEDAINSKIWENIAVKSQEMELETAMKKGATAMFDEKYEDTVRVVHVDDFSMELCGGTHVASTGEIGLFKIIKESSPGAGVRRIEGQTLKGILDRYNELEEIVSILIKKVNVTEKDLAKKVEDIIDHNKVLEKEMTKLKTEAVTSDSDSLLKAADEMSGIKVIAKVFNDVDNNALRELSDSLREKEQKAVVLLGSAYGGKVLLLFAATKLAVEKGVDCGALIKSVSKHVGGGGGGRKDMAQAGGKKPEGLQQSIDEAVNLLKDMIK